MGRYGERWGEPLLLGLRRYGMVRYGELEGERGRYGEAWGDMWRYGESRFVFLA